MCRKSSSLHSMLAIANGMSFILVVLQVQYRPKTTLAGVHMWAIVYQTSPFND